MAMRGTICIVCTCLPDVRYNLLEQFKAYTASSIIQQSVALDHKEHVEITPVKITVTSTRVITFQTHKLRKASDKKNKGKS